MKQKYLLLFLICSYWVYSQENDLPYQIKKVINRYKDTMHIGVEIVSIQNRDVIYSKNAHHLFTPASATKIIIAAAALDILGLNSRFATKMGYQGTLQNNQLHGDVYIKGCGDPTFSIDNIVQFFKKLQITTVHGGIYIDNSVFKPSLFAHGFLLENVEVPQFYTPVAPLMLDGKAYDVCIQETDHSYSLTCHYNLDRLQKVLHENGIQIMGGCGLDFKEFPDKNYTYIYHESEPLIQLIKHMLKTSNNIYADCICRALGNRLGRNDSELYSGSTWNKSIATIKKFLAKKVGIPKDEIVISDGSGMSRFNMISPQHINQVLYWILKQTYALDFVNALPNAGVDGTLKKRLTEYPNQIQAKTGTLNGVSALCGYILDTQSVFKYIFSIIINGFVQKSLLPELEPTEYTQGLSNPKAEIEDAICKILLKNLPCQNYLNDSF